ncbi:methyltransferase-like protein 13 isoform 1 [Nannochloropsis gaditana]|uniref:Methyltransferase-like protein 13 isoform 1 n=3 Tax=Nannochloropsis gaditana TaxID=72520 RepID=W7U397_9STRA|nr:methyltransferase-like protein 13 isoform 1 [Nannochloropsis gaditana]
MPPPVSASVLKSLKKASIEALKSPSAPSKPQDSPRDDLDLLPQHFQQFQDRAYWDAFFRERKQRAFEWYGTYNDLRPFVAKTVEGWRAGRKRERALVIGCGNSDFSADLYQEGGFQRIVNVDFSASVIEEMRCKTRESCPEMEWEVMDVTAGLAEGLGRGSFDVVLDKGTLDAIFSTPESECHADMMMDEVEDVLSPNGRYMVVTLGQDFILGKLLERFGGSRSGDWRLSLHAVEDPEAASPFLIIVGVASRGQAGEGDGKRISVHFDDAGRRLADDKARTFRAPDLADVLSLVNMAQERVAVKHELRDIVPGRFKGEIHIWLAPRSTDATSEIVSAAPDGPRYTLSIVDLVPQNPAPLPCAVFIIPQGREHDWLFSTADGLRQVGLSTDYRRLICVRMNRGHVFRDMDEVKTELGPVVIDFVPVDRDPAYMVPYLAVGDSIGARSAVVASGELPGCGRYCVEEEEDKDEDGKDRGAVVRRLIFYRNQHVIQSEVRLVPSPQKGKQKVVEGGKKKKKGSSTKKDRASRNTCPSAQNYAVDWSYLSFDYHRTMLGGLIALTYPHLRRAAKAQERRHCLLIGLGGGGLALFVRHYVPCLEVTVVELEVGLVDVAKEWFGFSCGGEQGLRVDAGNGHTRVLLNEDESSTEMERWDAIIVDVDNADASLGISCPAPDFLTGHFLESCRARLVDEGGILIMNVAARSSDLLEGSMEATRKIFASGEVHEARPTEQDVNRVLFALKTQRPTSASKLSLGVQTEKWLDECFPESKNVDPLGLCDLNIS